MASYSYGLLKSPSPSSSFYYYYHYPLVRHFTRVLPHTPPLGLARASQGGLDRAPLVKTKKKKKQKKNENEREKKKELSAPLVGPLVVTPELSAPLVGLRNPPSGNRNGNGNENGNGGFPWSRPLRTLWRRTIRSLASFPLAIGELAVLAGLLAMGTAIEQGEKAEFYLQNYGDNHPAFGFLDGQWILLLSLDHVYTSFYFLGLVALLAASLVACSWTRQYPMVKVARRWSFSTSESYIRKQEMCETLPKAWLPDLGTLLVAEGYQVFVQGPSLYAFKGLVGRLAPIGVHIALLLIIGGATWSAIGAYRGSVMVPQGLNFLIGDVMNPTGFLSQPIGVFNAEVHVNKFTIDNYPNGQVQQFRSDLSLVDAEGREITRRTISVNDPFRFGGITMYQTDWGISAIQVRADGEGPFNLVVAPLGKGEKKLFGAFFPLGDSGLTNTKGISGILAKEATGAFLTLGDSRLTNTKGISLLARDLQSVTIYDSEGKFAGVRRPGSDKPITVDGVQLLVDDVIGSTGLELKTDPSIPTVYAGFGALMLTTCISYLSHSQVWALQDGTSLLVGGKSNRAKAEFKDELNELFNCVPERLGSGIGEEGSISTVE